MSANGSRLELSKHQEVSHPLYRYSPEEAGRPIVRDDCAGSEIRSSRRKKSDARLTERRSGDREC